MMRYRDATSRPGRNRPSFSKYSAELEGREDELRDEGGRGGSGDVAVASRSIVAMSPVPVFEAGLPQDEQKRTLFDNSVPQAKHLAMNFSRYSLPQTLIRSPRKSKSWNPGRLRPGPLSNADELPVPVDASQADEGVRRSMSLA